MSDVVNTPRDEAVRRRALEALRALHLGAQPELDALGQAAARTCGASFGAVTPADREREWLEAVFGAPPPTPLRAAHPATLVRVDGERVVLEDTTEARDLDGRDALIQAGIRFYAGLPLKGRDGQRLGVLSVTHPEPLSPSPAQLDDLDGVARLAEKHLEVRLLALWLGAGQRALEDERERLLELRAKRRMLTSMLVHDLRNPLSVIVMTARFVKERAVDPAVVGAVDELLASGQVAESMVADVLDLAQAEAAELKVQVRPFDLRVTVARLIARLQYLAQYRGQTLQLIDGLTFPEVEADELLVERVLRNLLENGFKYGPANRPLRVVMAEAGDELELRVEDEGLPIPAPVRTRIFDEYFRLGATTQTRPGHGLGLAFCRLAVEAHGGRIWAEQRDPAGGNAFCVRLPARRAGRQRPVAG